MKIMPLIAIIVVLWILAHATIREYAVNAIVLVIASLAYLVRAALRREPKG